MSSRTRVQFVLLLFAVQVGIAAGQEPTLPDIAAGSDTGWHDLTFRIQSVANLSSGAQRLRAAGTYHTTPVALDVFLAPAWKAGRLDPKLALVTYTGRVMLRSLGPQSDRLLMAIDDLYRTAQHPHGMRRETEFTGISLEGDPRHLKAGPTKIKLFFESNDESRYAEFYLNIDLRAATLELAEKDADYRGPIVRALTAP